MSKSDIHTSALRNDIASLRIALAGGADVNQRDELGSSALHCAIAWNAIDAVTLLLEHGADVLLQDPDGQTALHYAIEHKLPRIAEAVVRQNPRVVSISNNHGNEPLWTAAFNARGDYDIVTMLLRHGADPDHRNHVGLTAKDIARRKGEAALLLLLDSNRACP